MNLATARTTLLAQLRTVSNIGVLTAENQDYKPVINTPFARFTFSPMETTVETTGVQPWQRIGGIVQVSLFAPRGGGSGSLYDKAELVIDAFPASTAIVVGDENLHIEKSWSEAVREEPQWLQMPVYIKWYAFKRQA